MLAWHPCPAQIPGKGSPQKESQTMSTIQNTAAYLKFVADLKSECEARGIPLVTTPGTETGLPENKGWVCFQSSVNGHKTYVPKSELRMGKADTTLPVANRAGAESLGVTRSGKPRVNGKIQCRVQPDARLMADLMEEFYGDSRNPLPANKLPTPKV